MSIYIVHLIGRKRHWSFRGLNYKFVRDFTCTPSRRMGTGYLNFFTSDSDLSLTSSSVPVKVSKIPSTSFQV